MREIDELAFPRPSMERASGTPSTSPAGTARGTRVWVKRDGLAVAGAGDEVTGRGEADAESSAAKDGVEG